MRIKHGVLALFCCLGLVALLPGQEEAELSKWMKTLGGESGKIRNATTKTGDEVVASAEKIKEAYEHTEAIFAKREMSDAVKWSQDGKAAAADLAAAAKAGDADKVAAAMKTVGGTCRPCHDAHREKLENGTYKIK